jgi:hypothetical protein
MFGQMEKKRSSTAILGTALKKVSKNLSFLVFRLLQKVHFFGTKVTIIGYYMYIILVCDCTWMTLKS